MVLCLATAVCFLTDPVKTVETTEPQTEPVPQEALFLQVQQIVGSDGGDIQARIAACQTEFDALVDGGLQTFSAFLDRLMAAADFGDEEYVMAAVCSEITGVAPMSASPVWTDAGQWLAIYQDTVTVPADEAVVSALPGYKALHPTKGLVLFVWKQDDGTYRCCLLEDTELGRTYTDASQMPAATPGQMRRILQWYPEKSVTQVNFILSPGEFPDDPSYESYIAHYAPLPLFTDKEISMVYQVIGLSDSSSDTGDSDFYLLTALADLDGDGARESIQFAAEKKTPQTVRITVTTHTAERFTAVFQPYLTGALFTAELSGSDLILTDSAGTHVYQIRFDGTSVSLWEDSDAVPLAAEQ